MIISLAAGKEPAKGSISIHENSSIMVHVTFVSDCIDTKVGDWAWWPGGSNPSICWRRPKHGSASGTVC